MFAPADSDSEAKSAPPLLTKCAQKRDMACPPRRTGDRGPAAIVSGEVKGWWATAGRSREPSGTGWLAG